METKTSGGCLCGAVRYEITGKLRNIINCHCSKCRRFHGHFGAYTSVRKKDLRVIKKNGLTWFGSTTDETPGVQRGFCSVCGSSLFWHPRGWKIISIAAGSLDNTEGLKTQGHIWVGQMADYYFIEDGLPRFQERWEND